MAFFEKKWYFTDGVLIATLTGMRYEYFFGVDVTTTLGDMVVGSEQFTVREFGSYGKAKNYALQQLRNGKFERINRSGEDGKGD